MYGHSILFLSLLLVGLPSLIDALSAAVSPLARGESRFFLDTASTDEWNELIPLGIFHGITTNPTILERCGVPCNVEAVHELAATALDMVDEFLCQAWGSTAEEMYNIGMALSAPDRERIVIKCPVTAEGTKAASRLINKGVRVCLTACYNSNQALVAASCGAEYLAPYLGRMTDAGRDGLLECQKMQAVVDGMGSATRIMVASIRNADDMATLAAAGGCDTFTFSPDCSRSLFSDDLTNKAAADFEEAAKRGGA
mmetsp:Transcript_27959/g.80793  ORF Transcript_27959/g.80793 Transcript_27959/m.80793 type:complete len:255 (+) Transcript_27959:108-872(+)